MSRFNRVAILKVAAPGQRVGGRSPLAPAAALLAAGLVVSASAACTTLGERAETGECPDGEVCSSVTPRGLTFAGARFSDESLFGDPSVKVTAVGGRQTLTVRRVDDVGSSLFSHPFRVTFSPGSVEAPSVSPPYLTLKALAEGQSLMRLVETNSDVLFDRVNVDAAAVETVEAPPPGEAGDLVGPWSFYRASTALLVVQLRGDGHRLVDEDMVIEVQDASGAAAGSQADWDAARLTPNLAGAAVFLVVTAAGGAPVTLEIPLDDGVDAIEIVEEEPAFPEAPTVDAAAWACFAGLANTGTADERRVYGLPWSFEVTGPAELSDFGGVYGPNCVLYAPTDVGEITITVTAPGATFDYTVTAVPAASPKASPSPPPPRASVPTLGWRARAAR